MAAVSRLSGRAREAVRLCLAVAATALLAFGAAGTAVAAGGLAAGDPGCFACHANKDLALQFANGDTVSAAVDEATFRRSVHGAVGCVGCHPGIDPRHHPGGAFPVASSRQYTLDRNQACRACHARVFRIYEGSVHAIRLRSGSTFAPACSGCHRPHDVTPASVQDGPQNACTTCHGDTAASHEQWLPNAVSHLRSVACLACHAVEAVRGIDLRLYVGDRRLVDGDGSLRFERRARAADADHDGLDAGELRALIADLERDGYAVALRGHVALRSGMEAHELSPRALALKDCRKCHDERAVPFQYVTVSALDSEGRPVRYDAHKSILGSAVAWEALRGFYAIGGTRIKVLDVALALGLAGGIAVPALHFAVRRLCRRQDRDSSPR